MFFEKNYDVQEELDDYYHSGAGGAETISPQTERFIPLAMTLTIFLTEVDD
jgi:hypothetical protein